MTTSVALSTTTFKETNKNIYEDPEWGWVQRTENTCILLILKDGRKRQPSRYIDQSRLVNTNFLPCPRKTKPCKLTNGLWDVTLRQESCSSTLTNPRCTDFGSSKRPCNRITKVYIIQDYVLPSH